MNIDSLLQVPFSLLSSFKLSVQFLCLTLASLEYYVLLRGAKLLKAFDAARLQHWPFWCLLRATFSLLPPTPTVVAFTSYLSLLWQSFNRSRLPNSRLIPRLFGYSARAI